MKVNMLSTTDYEISKKKTNTGEVGKSEPSEAEKLEAFKKEIWNEINRMPRCSSINWSIQITDGGFKRMMEDSAYREKIMSVLAEDAAVGRPPITTSMCRIDENGLTGASYNFEYGEEAFEAHSNDKDCFYKKKDVKKIDYEELWEEQRVKRKQRQDMLDEKIVRAEQERSRLAKTWTGKRQRAASSVYESSVMTKLQ